MVSFRSVVLILALLAAEKTELQPFIILMLSLFQAKNKGLVMVNFFSYFLTCSNKSSVNDVVGRLCVLLYHLSSYERSENVLCSSFSIQRT